MQGIRNIILGFVFIAAGGGVMVAVDLRGGMLEWGAWGLVAMGVVMFGGGIYQAVGPGSAGADAENAYKTSSTARLLMQSMLTTALADGPLADEEVRTIADACESVVHERLDPASIRRLADRVEKRGDAILAEIRQEGKMLNLDERKNIVAACVMVLAVGGDADVRETAAVNAIGLHLGFSEFETQTMIVQAMPAEKKLRTR